LNRAWAAVVVTMTIGRAQSMPRLIAFLLKNLTIGALIGLAVALVLLATGSVGAHLQSNDYLPAAMVAYALASTFAIGFLSTALLFLE
jgi:hypothetical protein